MWTVAISESEDQNDDSDEEESAEYATEEEPDEQHEHQTNEVVNYGDFFCLDFHVSLCKYHLFNSWHVGEVSSGTGSPRTTQVSWYQKKHSLTPILIINHTYQLPLSFVIIKSYLLL